LSYVAGLVDFEEKKRGGEGKGGKKKERGEEDRVGGRVPLHSPKTVLRKKEGGGREEMDEPLMSSLRLWCAGSTRGKKKSLLTPGPLHFPSPKRREEKESICNDFF